MKTQSELIKKGLLAGFLATSLLMSVGCAKKSDGFSASDTPADQTPAVTTPETPRDTDGPRGPEFSNGATAALELDSMAALTAYVAQHPVNNPQDLRISVKAYETGPNQYAGDVYISYYDNGQYYTGHFNTRDERTASTPSNVNLYPNYRHSYYNNWFTWNGKPAFHGFFEDNLGAVLLIIDGAINEGDGAGAVEVSGSIWFKNHAVTQFPRTGDGLPCWFLTTAAYDCRTFLTAGGPTGDGNITSDSALYPTDSKWYTSRSTHPYHPVEPARGWRRLGTFNGLNKSKAFSQ